MLELMCKFFIMLTIVEHHELMLCVFVQPRLFVGRGMHESAFSLFM
jgi:hypothetical protein